LNLANGKDSQQRSERREGCLIHYLDLLTLRVGIPQDDGSFGGIGLEWIAELSGMGLRRVERATHDLVAAGIVVVAGSRRVPPEASALVGRVAHELMASRCPLVVGCCVGAACSPPSLARC
jgi:hypothetical protein